MEGGFYAKYRSAAPQQLSMLTVGIKPFAGFYYAREMTTLPLVSVAIAQAVASTVKNVLPYVSVFLSLSPHPINGLDLTERR